MTIFHSLDEAQYTDAWITIGVFDGVHRGHQKVLQELIQNAHETGGPAVVLTFDPHPAEVFGGLKDFPCLTLPEERAELMLTCGVDVVIIQRFDRIYADQTAETFMTRLAKKTGLCGLIAGYDTALGRGREGTVPRLAKLGEGLGYRVQVVEPLKDEKGIISSTRIRHAIIDGRVSDAAIDLGRYYFIQGMVVHGDGRGHRINLPTANIEVPRGKVPPANGIYACRAWVGNRGYLAAVNVGVRPTFTPDLTVPIIEAHLLDFNQDLYGHNLKLEFVEYLRPEEKYDSVDALMGQIRIDIANTRKIVS